MPETCNVVTVVTPTYNRAKELNDLYQSLILQTAKDFTWLIIDDGSEDNTQDIVTAWITESKIRIDYKKKNNGGKHTALNYSYRFVTSPLIFIVDSDDHLTPNAISTIIEKYNLYKDESDLCGFSFLRGKPNGGYLSTGGVPQNNLKESYVECRINRKIGGDMAEVWFTHCLKEYLFPEFEGEKFLGEDVVWVRMSEKYKLRYYNDVIYISDYLDTGLTNNRRKHNIASPKGCVNRAEAFLNSNVIFSQKIKAMLQFIIYGRFARFSYNHLFKRSKRKLLYMACFIPAVIIYSNWKNKYI